MAWNEFNTKLFSTFKKCFSIFSIRVYLQDGGDVLLAVEGQVIHGQFLKFVGHDVERLAGFALQQQTRKLLQHHFGQTDVADLETTPKGPHVLTAEIQRVLAEERGFASARRPSEHRQFATTVALEQIRQDGEATPTDARHFAALRDLFVNFFPKIAKNGVWFFLNLISIWF